MSEFFQQHQFLTVQDRDEAEKRFRDCLQLNPLETESIPLTEALGRILAEDIFAPIDVPGFDRSNVDGFAVRSEDTFGAAEDSPLPLTLNAEEIAPKVTPKISLQPHSATPIATGAMLPRGADGVVMIEHTQVINEKLIIKRPVAPGMNVSFTGSDIGCGELILRRGERLTSRETGVLAALGIAFISVVRQPWIAILSTGNELASPGQPIQPGMIYDSNSTILGDAVRELGGSPEFLGIVPDDPQSLRRAFQQALNCDLVLVSGGTSKGAADISYRIVNEFGSPGIVAHGVALKPGKPLCLAVISDPPKAYPEQDRRPVPVAILPGFPTSAVFTFHEFIAPIIRIYAGRAETESQIVSATLSMRVNSERGRTEYLLVSLIESEKGYIAFPMGKGSGSVTAFSKADGFITIPRQQEYLEPETKVDVQLLASQIEPADLVVIGSHCIGLDFLLNELQLRGIRSKVLTVGSMGGLEAVRRGEADLAGIHLLDPVTNEYNRAYLATSMRLIKGYGRLQGIVFRSDDLPQNGSPEEIIERILQDPSKILANRNRGSGTRILLDQYLHGRKPSGYLSEFRSHQAVAAAIAQTRADWGIAIQQVAHHYRLGFLPLRAEEFDFVTTDSRITRPGMRTFLTMLQDPKIRSRLEEMGFMVCSKL